MHIPNETHSFLIVGDNALLQSNIPFVQELAGRKIKFPPQFTVHYFYNVFMKIIHIFKDPPTFKRHHQALSL